MKEKKKEVKQPDKKKKHYLLKGVLILGGIYASLHVIRFFMDASAKLVDSSRNLKSSFKS